MKKISDKQSLKNRDLAKIKDKLPKRCVICGNIGNDLAHLLPKSIYPEHYTDEWNLVIFCRHCHTMFDDSRHFRAQQTLLFLQVAEHNEQAARRYFDTDIH